jgi:hypothetical protein
MLAANGLCGVLPKIRSAPVLLHARQVVAQDGGDRDLAPTRVRLEGDRPLDGVPAALDVDYTRSEVDV